MIAVILQSGLCPVAVVPPAIVIPSALLNSSSLRDENIEVIESFCYEVRDGLDNATFEDKRRYMDLLDLRCKMALEDQEKAAYVKCKLGPQRLSVAPTLPSSSNRNRPPIEITARLVIERLNQTKNSPAEPEPEPLPEITIPVETRGGGYDL